MTDNARPDQQVISGEQSMLTVAELAQFLGVSRRMVHAMVRNKLIIHYRVGIMPESGPDRRPIRFTIEDVRAYLDTCCVLGPEAGKIDA